MDLTPLQFLLLVQFIIFLLGWPLEWSEIIIIFVPIFLPLLPYYDIDPLFFGILVALNLQTAFLTPPMAMSAYYLKGIAPGHMTLVQIFNGSRSEEHTPELQSLMRNSYAVFSLKKKKNYTGIHAHARYTGYDIKHDQR